MALLLAFLGVFFAAACVWLAVRIINRRERWAKWTLVGLIAIPSLYLLSFGPAWWLRVHVLPASSRTTMDAFYTPIGILNRWEPFNRAAARYVILWVDRDDAVKAGTDVNPPATTPDATSKSN